MDLQDFLLSFKDYSPIRYDFLEEFNELYEKNDEYNRAEILLSYIENDDSHCLDLAVVSEGTQFEEDEDKQIYSNVFALSSVHDKASYQLVLIRSQNTSNDITITRFSDYRFIKDLLIESGLDPEDSIEIKISYDELKLVEKNFVKNQTNDRRVSSYKNVPFQFKYRELITLKRVFRIATQIWEINYSETEDIKRITLTDQLINLIKPDLNIDKVNIGSYYYDEDISLEDNQFVYDGWKDNIKALDLVAGLPLQKSLQLANESFYITIEFCFNKLGITIDSDKLNFEKENIINNQAEAYFNLDYNLAEEEYLKSDSKIISIELLYDGITYKADSAYNALRIDSGKVIGYPSPIIRFGLDKEIDSELFRRSVFLSSFSIDIFNEAGSNDINKTLIFEDHNGYSRVLEGDDLFETTEDLDCWGLSSGKKINLKDISESIPCKIAIKDFL